VKKKKQSGKIVTAPALHFLFSIDVEFALKEVFINQMPKLARNEGKIGMTDCYCAVRSCSRFLKQRLSRVSIGNGVVSS
jgi:hypothetical protein